MSSHNKLLGILFSALLLTGVAGCDKKTPQTAGQTVDKAMDSAGKQLSQANETVKKEASKLGDVADDAALTAKVKAALVADSNLSALQINVQTANGVVTLSGTVDSSANIDHAKQIATNVKGVTSVDNRLTVKAPG